MGKTPPKLEPRGRSRRLTIPERNVGAETRAVEEGHRAHVQPGGWVKVLSDTHGDIGKWFHVEFVTHIDGLISFSCRPEGPKAYKDDHLAASAAPGTVPCKHAALAARALERHDLATYDGHGRWSVPDGILDELRARVEAATPENLLEGLPH